MVLNNAVFVHLYMHLLYITFGSDLKNHTQAYFSIYSFLVKKEHISSINVITDHPGFYKSIERHLNIIGVNQHVLNEWKGAYDFFWRIKIKGIEKVCNLYKSEPVLYLDSDTFLYNDLFSLQQTVNEGNAAMFINEGPVSALKSKTMRKMTGGLRKMQFDGLGALQNYNMWNAGVALVPNTKGGEDIKMILEFCDALCANKITDQFIEQFALSVGLAHFYGLQSADSSIAHYWSNKKEWDEVIKKFFVENHMLGLGFDEELKRFANIDFSKHPVTKISKNTKRRLSAMLDRVMKDKKVEYIRYDM